MKEKKDKNDKLIAGITEIRDLKFRIENEIKRIVYFIKEAKYKISEFKQAEFTREEDRDIFISSKDEILKIEQELSVKLFLLKKN